MPMPFINIAPLPIKTDRTLRAVPYVTYAICFICIMAHLVNLRLSEYQFYQLAMNWGFIINEPSLRTLFSHAFLHGDIWHLAGNLFILWLIGTVLESGIGSLMFALLYLASLVFSVILYGTIGKLFLPDSLDIPLIGASGAIAGVTGFAAFRYFRLRVFTILVAMLAFIPIPIPLWLPLWSYSLIFAAKELLSGLAQIHGEDSMVAHWAHIGGLVLGGIMGVVLNMVSEGKREFALSDSTKAVDGRDAIGRRSLQELEELLRQNQEDPEVLEAIAGLAMLNGEYERSASMYLKAIPLFLTTGLADRAAISYLNLLKLEPGTVFPPREQMTLAANLERAGHYSEASQAFLLVAEQYADQEDAATALLRAAQIHQRYLNDQGTARMLLQNVLDDYPNSSWSDLARLRLNGLK